MNNPLYNRLISLVISLGIFHSALTYADDFDNSATPQLPASVLEEKASYVETPYAQEQSIMFDFFLDDPQKIHSALYWVRSYINTLTNEPYGAAPEFLNIIILIHGTEIVTLAKKNYPKYASAVQRMRYYEQLGVTFRVCGDAVKDYGYQPEDLYGFVEIIPNAITEIAHWQNEGYAIVSPVIFEKKFSIDEIR